MGYLSLNDVCMIEDDPRIQDLRLAEALGVARPTSIRELLDRNTAELERYGNLSYRTIYSGERGRPATECWLNEAQAILVAMKAQTPRAEEVRQEIIKVFMDYRHGRSLPVLPIQNTIDLFGSMLRQELAPVRKDLGDLRDHIVRVEGNVTFLAGRVDDIVPRRDFSKATKEQLNAVVFRRYACDCPSCRQRKILDQHGKPVAGELNYDHFNGRELNSAEDGWPVCAKCNHQFRLNNEFKIKSRPRFETFQQDRRDLFRSALIQTTRRFSSTVKTDRQYHLPLSPPPKAKE